MIVYWGCMRYHWWPNRLTSWLNKLLILISILTFLLILILILILIRIRILTLINQFSDQLDTHSRSHFGVNFCRHSGVYRVVSYTFFTCYGVFFSEMWIWIEMAMNRDEEEILRDSVADKAEVWLGMTSASGDITHQHEYYWITGHPVTYTNWNVKFTGINLRKKQSKASFSLRHVGGVFRYNKGIL